MIQCTCDLFRCSSTILSLKSSKAINLDIISRLFFLYSISSLKTELSELRSVNTQYEHQRSEMTSRLQQMMQSHCSEALKLLQGGSSVKDVVSV